MTDIGRRLAIGMLVASVSALPIGPMGASAAEVCHYTGSTDYDGHVAVTTNVTESDGVTRVARIGDGGGPCRHRSLDHVDVALICWIG